MRFYIDFKDLPFKSDIFQVVYVEKEYNQEANQYIRDHFDQLCKAFADVGYEFCYIPKLPEKLASKQILEYYAPYNYGVLNTPVGSDLFLSFMLRPENRVHIPASLLYWDINCIRANNEQASVKYRGISFDELIDLTPAAIANEVYTDAYRVDSQIVRAECNDGGEEQIRFRCSDQIHYDSETERLLDELRHTIDKLQQRGVTAYILEQMINQPAKQSRLLITHDYRIFLPDYKNMEIVMTPLAKAVYLLFLNHPEGIIFKSLPDYYDELLDIYMRIKKVGLKVRAEESIRDITNPLSNSINEKCARIRAAFVSKFDERLAQNYIVRGERGEAKRIELDRDLIIREDKRESKSWFRLPHITDEIEFMNTLNNNEDDII